MKYKEEIKIKARKEVLSYAINCLTEKKHDYGYLINEEYVEKVIAQLKSRKHQIDDLFVQQLSDASVETWKKFYRNGKQEKKVSEIKVAYLSGPNPENDLQVLVDLGVLPENVWTFESDNKTYDKAVMNTLSSDYPFIKIIKGKIKNFFEYSPVKFDIVYLDFCGSITNSDSISTLLSLFYNHSISSAGVLITNFAYVDEETDPTLWNNTMKLCANYLSAKSFVESHEGLGGGWVENSTFCHGTLVTDYVGLLQSNPLNSYSQFITRVLFDIASVISPYQRLAKNKSILNLFFEEFDKMKIPDEWFEDLEMGALGASLIMSLKNQLPFQDGFDWEEIEDLENFDEKEFRDFDFEKFFKKFIRNLSVDNNEKKLIEILGKIEYLNKGNDSSSFYSDKLKNIVKNWNFSKTHIFCDVFLFHQVLDILMRQICVPYHYNMKLIKRWVYKAKQTEMFLDVLPLEECRYLYDWMPTIDMFESGIDNIERQLIFRFVMDGLSKHNHWYSEEFLSGTAVTSMDEPGFNVLELNERIRIN